MIMFGVELGLQDICSIVEAVANSLSAFGIIGGGIWTLRRWRKAQKLQSASYFNELVTRFQSSEVGRLFYMIDDARYGGEAGRRWKAWIGELFLDPEKESQLDRLLSFLSYACYLEKQGLVDSSVAGYFKYPRKSVLMCNEIKDYLQKGLEEYPGENNPYHLLIAYAETVGIKI